MSTPRYFSETYGINRPTGGLVRNDVPRKLRNAVRGYVRGLSPSGWSSLWLHVVGELHLDPDLRSRNQTDYRHQENFGAMNSWFEVAPWHEVLDARTAIYTWLAEDFEDKTAEWANTLNSWLLRHYSAYRMEPDGCIIEPAGRPVENAISQTRVLLRSSALAGPEEQFTRALEAFHHFPDPDYAGAVGSAVGATEGTARAVLGLGNKKVSFSDILKQIADEKKLHPAVFKSIESLYGFATQEAGRHGQAAPSTIDGPLAEYAMHQCSAAIVLVARLYGHEVA